MHLADNLAPDRPRRPWATRRKHRPALWLALWVCICAAMLVALAVLAAGIGGRG